MPNDLLQKYITNRRIEAAENRRNAIQNSVLSQQKREYESQIKAQEEEQARQQSERDNASFWQKAGATVADFFTELGGGLFKAGEGIVDALVSVGGGIGGIFGADTKWAEDFVKYDATQKLWYNWEDELTKNSYMNDAPIVKDVVRGVGQQLPTIAAIAAAPFTGGATLAAVPYLQGAQAISAGGQSVEEALNENASFGQALGYGTVQGGMEFLLEQIPLGTGKIASTVMKEGAQSAVRSVGKNVAKSVLEEALQEAIQEGISAFANPATKTIYKGSEALQEYKNPDFYKDVGYQALVGGITGGISAGASTGLHIRAAGGNASYNLQSSVAEITALDKKENNLWKNGKLTDSQSNKMGEARQAELERISNQLTSVDKKQRTELINKYKLSEMFNEDGTIAPTFARTATDGQTLTESATSLENANKAAYSPSLKNRKLILNPKQAALTEADIETKKTISNLAPSLKMVFADTDTRNDTKFNAFVDGDVIYIADGASSADVMRATAVHEITHTLEGTKQYAKLAEHAKESINNDYNTALKFLTKRGVSESEARVALDSSERTYFDTIAGFEGVRYEGVNTHVKQGEAGKVVAGYEATTEAIADYMGDLLSNEQSIQRIVNQNKSLAARIYNWVKNAVAKLAGKGDTKSENYKLLRQTERLYAKAIKNAAGGVSLTKMYEKEKEALAKFEEMAATEETLANGEESGYNDDTEGDTDGRRNEETRYSIDDEKRNDLLDRSSTGRRGGRDISVRDDAGAARPLSEIVGERTNRRLTAVADSIYANPKTETQKNIVWHAKNENTELYFFKPKQNENEKYVLDGEKVFLNENASEKDFVDILNKEKPIKRNLDPKKIAHISEERYNRFLRWQPNAFLTRIPIQTFLDMTTADYVEQRQLNARSQQVSKQVGVENIKNIPDEIYLEIDFKNNKITNHEGRHRMTALLNAGNTYADVFVIPKNVPSYESKASVAVRGQFTNKEFDIGVVRADSKKYASAINSVFKSDDGNIRYSLKDGKGGYNYSKAQIAKYIANNTKAKAYARTDAAAIVDGIVNEQLNFGDKYGKLDGKTRSQATDELFHKLNAVSEGYRVEVALDIAEFIIKNAIVTDLHANSSTEADLHIIRELKPYLGRVNMESIKGDIDSHYGADKSPYNRWGKRKGKTAVSPDQIAMELQDSGMRFSSDNPADIFIEMDGLYRDAQESLKRTKAESKKSIKDFATEDELAALKQNIAREVLVGYDETGYKTKFQRTVERYTDKISNLKTALKESKKYNKAVNNLLSTVERAKKFKEYADVSAATKLPEAVSRFVKEIAKIETWRGNLNKTARNTLSKINAAYQSILGNNEAGHEYVKAAAEIAGKDIGVPLTTEEVRTIDAVLQNFIHEVKTYDKVFFQGKNISETEIAEKGIHEAGLAQIIRTKHSGLSAGIRNFFESIYNPLRVFQSALGYIDNSVTEGFYKDIMDGNRRRAAFVQKSNNLLKEFFESKEFLKSSKESVTIKGDGTEATMTRSEMLSLYLTLKREQGLSHITGSGKVRLLNPDFVKKNNIKEAQLRGKDVAVDETMLKSIESELTKTEKEFVKTVREFFDTVAKDAKVETDKILSGVTNALQEDYYPIKTADSEVYKEVGTNTDILQTIRNFGFNIDSVPNASSQLVIESVFDVVARHISGMSIYYGYAIPITTYNRVMNKKTLGGTLRTEIAKINPKFDSYVNNWFLDIQGIVRGEIGLADKTMGYLRGMLARAALGLNPKVLLSQTVSLASALSEFNPKYVAKGIPGGFSKQAMTDVLKYSPLMAERNDLIGNIDVSELRANTNKMDGARKKVNKVLDAPLKAIEFMDSHVIAVVYQSALNEQADILKKPITSEEVKEAAARRTEDVVFRSQQTSDPVGRSSLMRSRSQFVRLFTMFKGDAFQLTSQFVSSIDRLLSYRKMLKSGNAELVAMAKNGMPEAQKAFAKSGTAVLMNVTWLTLIAMVMKAVKGWGDDDKKEFAAQEVISNIMGMLPLGGEFYNLLSGYDLDNPAYSALSTIATTAKDIYTNAGGLINGEQIDEVKTRAAARRTALGFAQLLGVPLRNIESYGIGIVGNINAATRAEYDALFKTKSNTAYMEAITKAIEKGDYAAADTYINIMFDSRTGRIKDDKVLEVMRDLIEAGYTNVLPKSLGASITYDSETIELTSKQHKAFKEIYSKASDTVKTMVNSKAFAKLDQEAQAKAIKRVYDYYYNLGLEDLLGEDIENKTILFGSAVPIEYLAMVAAQAQLYEAETDKTGRVVSGSRKTKVEKLVQSLNLTAVQKYIVMGYLGYTNAKGAAQVKSYINSLKLSKEQKEKLYKESGYTLTTGRRAA